MELNFLSFMNRVRAPFGWKCGFVLLTAFCVGFTLAYFSYLVIISKTPLDVFASFDGDLRLRVYSILRSNNENISNKKHLLETCIRSEATAARITGERLPGSFFRSRGLHEEFNSVMTNFYAIKERSEK